MEKTVKNGNRTRIILAVDTVMLAAFLVATSPQFGGLAVHEWLGIACGVLVIVHLLLSWDWIVAVPGKLFKAACWQTRLGYLLNIALFIDVTLLIYTGLAISKVALTGLGISLPRSGDWLRLHSRTSDLFVLLLGLHLALHWSWIVATVKRLFGRLRAPRLAAPQIGEGVSP